MTIKSGHWPLTSQSRSERCVMDTHHPHWYLPLSLTSMINNNVIYKPNKTHAFLLEVQLSCGQQNGRALDGGKNLSGDR